MGPQRGLCHDGGSYEQHLCVTVASERYPPPSPLGEASLREDHVLANRLKLLLKILLKSYGGFFPTVNIFPQVSWNTC